MWEISYQQHSKFQKLLYKTGQIRKIHCSIRDITPFPKAYPKHLQTDKHLLKKDKKLDVMKVKQFMIETTDMSVKKCDICKIYYHFINENMKILKSIVIM